MKDWIKITNDNFPKENVDVYVWNGICQAVSCRYSGSWSHDIDYYDYEHITHYRWAYEPPKDN